MSGVGDRFLANLQATQTDSPAADVVPFGAAQWREPFDHSAAIGKASGSQRSSLHQIKMQAPYLWDAMLALSRYVTPLFPGRRTTLLGDVVPRALGEFNAAEREGDRLGAEVAFLKSIARAADQVMAVQALATGQQTDEMMIWDVWSESLPAWLTRHNVECFYFRAREPLLSEEVAGAQSALLARLVSHREMGLIVRAGGLL